MNLNRLGFILYRRLLGPALHFLVGPGFGCRFEPTCSCYAEEALERYGVIRGGGMALGRVLRCHPWSKGGWDPVSLVEKALVTKDG